MRKIIPYLLLNFVVSAAAMLLVLLIWNWTHPTPAPVTLALATPTPVAVLATPLQAIPINEKTMRIQVVAGVGDVANEQVSLLSESTLPIDLQGWKLVDDDSNEFIFPLMTIFPGGGVTVHSMNGVNDSSDLFWASADPIWSSGETASLYDASGNLRSSYKIP